MRLGCSCKLLHEGTNLGTCFLEAAAFHLAIHLLLLQELRLVAEETAEKIQEFYSGTAVTSTDFVAKGKAVFEVMEGQEAS